MLWHNALKTCRGVEVKFHTFLTAAVDGGGMLALCSVRLIHGDELTFSILITTTTTTCRKYRESKKMQESFY